MTFLSLAMAVGTLVMGIKNPGAPRIILFTASSINLGMAVYWVMR